MYLSQLDKLTAKTWVLSFLKTILKFGFSNLHDFDVYDSKDLPAKNQFQIWIKNQPAETKKKSFKKAWEILKFETENYWRRATYFWAFQIAAFAGYFSISGSDKFKNVFNTYALFFTICVGFLTAFAWVLTNIGSKEWQNHWVSYIIILEDEFTGPLLKGEGKKRVSVTNVNEVVSRFISVIWVLLVIQYFSENITFRYTKYNHIAWPVIISFVITIYFSCALYYGYGRPGPSKKKVNVVVKESPVS